MYIPNAFKLVADGYLYSFRNGVFKVQKGQLFMRESNRYVGRFYVNDKKFYTCSSKEGDLANRIAWFSIRDDDRVRDIFMLHEEDRIERLNSEIKRCEDNLIELSSAKIVE